MKQIKKEKSDGRTMRVLRRDQLYENWRLFVVQLYGNGGMVPTLDWRGGIVIDHVRSGAVAFCVTYMMTERGRLMDDQDGSFFFTGHESRQVFDRYHRLKGKISRSNRPESSPPVYLRPETWTGRKIHTWEEPFTAEDIDMAIASLVAYWDACAAKPPLAVVGETQRFDSDEEFWNLKPLPKMLRVQGLPAKLARELRKQAKAMPNPMRSANPPVKRM